MGESLLAGDPPVAPADPHATGEVVEPQRGGVRLGHRLVEHPVSPEQRDEERQHADQVGSVLEQALALGEVLVDERELPLLEVAQPSVDQLGGLRRRAGREIAALDQRGTQTARGGVEGHPGPGDAASDHEEVEVLLGHSGEGDTAVEGAVGGVLCHGPSISLSYDVRNPSRSTGPMRSRLLTSMPAPSTRYRTDTTMRSTPWAELGTNAPMAN